MTDDVTEHKETVIFILRNGNRVRIKMNVKEFSNGNLHIMTKVGRELRGGKERWWYG